MLLKQMIIATSLLASSTLLIACKSGYNRIYNDDTDDDEEDRPTCITSTVFTNASDNTMRVFDLIADLTCKRTEDFEDLVIVGQSLGVGNEIADVNNEERSYESLIQELADSTNRRIAIASVEYEEEELFSLANLEEANDILISHFERSGIISVTWTPLNPWTSDNTNITNPLAASDDDQLPNLYGDDENADGKRAFDDQLDIIIDALQNLEESDVPVLFAPFPEMNSTSYWYGPEDSDTSDANFRELWNYVLNELRAESLTNIIMVYAPRSGTTSQRVSATWGYPGASSVDIVAGISFSDEVSILDYNDYEELNKPLGMTRLAPSRIDGAFDNQSYVTELQGRYPFIAYWIAEHDTAAPNEIKRSIKSTENSNRLLNNSKVITAEVIAAEEWLETDTN